MLDEQFERNKRSFAKRMLPVSPPLKPARLPDRLSRFTARVNLTVYTCTSFLSSPLEMTCNPIALLFFAN